MELSGAGGGWRKISRETSPDRARSGYIHRPRRAQIIYYLSRNGQLDHPHFMELPLPPTHHIRLKDVMDRLKVLRGSGMPSLYSWSCKRSYKNGYVWNDLSENDVIYPADGAEYVLKGSEIIRPLSDGFQQESRRPRPLPVSQSSRHLLLVAAGDHDEEEQMEEVRCSRGVSTDQELEKPNKYQPNELPLDDASPPSSSSSDKAPPPATVTNSRRYEECDSESEPVLGRNSVFMQLISCGSMAAKGRVPSGDVPCGRKSGSLYKGVMSKAAAAEVGERRYAVVEEKEYFSGSIVEAASTRVPPEPVLKKSSSYNEERSSKLDIGEGTVDHKDETENGGVRGKCMPARKRTSSKPQQQLMGKTETPP